MEEVMMIREVVAADGAGWSIEEDVKSGTI